MTLRKALSLIRATGHVAEPAPERPAPMPNRPQELTGTVHVRHVDAGSCNGCEIEIGNAFGPVYDVERYGVHLVASPRHADVILATGVVTQNMVEPLRRTIDATPRPRLVIAMGDCARNCGMFAGGHGVVGSVADVVDVDLEIAGCPPEPVEIVRALRSVTGT